MNSNIHICDDQYLFEHLRYVNVQAKWMDKEGAKLNKMKYVNNPIGK